MLTFYSLKWFNLFIALIFFLIGQVAEAQNSEAKSKFEEGIKKIENEDYDAALKLFEASYSIKPKAVVLFNIAMCQKALYNYAEALNLFQRYLDEAGDSPKPDLRGDAKSAMLDIERYIGRMTIVGAPEKSLVYVNGVFKARIPLNSPLILNPGRHLFRIQSEDGKSFETAVVIASGATLTLEVNMSQSAKERLPQKNIQPDKMSPATDATNKSVSKFVSAEQKSERSKKLVLASSIGAFSLGACSGIVGLVYSIAGQKKYSEARDLIHFRDGDAYVYPEDYEQYEHIRKNIMPRAAAGMIVGFSLAAAFATTGLVLLIKHKKENIEKRGSVKFMISPSMLKMTF